MGARPLYRQTDGSLLAQLAKRVDALERRRDVSGHYEIKLFGDDQAVTTGDGRFIFEIPIDLDQSKLRYIRAYVTTVGSSETILQIHNVGSAAVPAAFDMLDDPLQIDASEKSSETSSAPWSIFGQEQPTPSYAQYGFPVTDNTVYYKQHIRIDIDSAGSGAMGLGIHLGFD